MKVCVARLRGHGQYSPSRAHETESLNKEGKDEYEKRTWREKAHYVANTGQLFIPAMAFKMALDSAAKFTSRQIPGKGKSTYTKHFLAGVLVLENAPIDAHKDQVNSIRIYANADGVRGSGKRVWRYFPVVDEWETEVTFHVVDDTITEDVFEETLREAGKFIGIGRFRPQNGGFNGRWEVVDTSWSAAA